MDAAALIYFVLSCGINYGWQPMPDGSERAEYLVQIEPEILDALQKGQAIPITSDIPDDVGPIGRVRITVGHENLPRQKLSTRLKPESEARHVEQAQYTTPVASQPATAPPLIDPRNLTTSPAPGQAASSADPFAQAVQDSAIRIRQSAEQVRQSADQILSGQNKGPIDSLDRTDHPTSSQLDRRSAAVSEAPRYSGSDPRYNSQSTPDQVGRWESKTRYDDRQPFREQTIGAREQTAAEDSRLSRGPTGRRPTTLNIGPPPQTTVDAWLNQSFDNQGTNNQRNRGYNSSNTIPRISDNTARQPNTLDGPRLPPLDDPSRRNDAPTAAEKSAATSSPFGMPNEETDGYAPPAYDLPDTTNSRTTNSLATHESTDRSGKATTRIETTSTPTIRREMLAQPAEVPVPVDSQPRDQFSGHADPIHSDGMQPSDNRFRGLGQQDDSTEQRNRPSADSPRSSNRFSTRQIDQASAASSNASKFPLLLAWVLLSGSAAGNLYLFWSYLDVRGKYQAIVRSTRGLGSRFSGT